MTNLQITATHRTAQAALNDLWYRYYTAELTQDARNGLAQAFIDDWLIDPPFNPAEAFIFHPATSKRDYTRVTVTDVLTDFVLRALQSDEKNADYPVENPDRQVNGKFLRRDSELSLISDGDLPEDEDGEPSAAELPRDGYSVLESDVPDSYTPRTMSVEDAKRQLERVKAFAPYYAERYAEARGYAVNEVQRRIRRLDVDRVRECPECGNGFYAHDLRRQVCDMQIGIGTELSACEKRAKNRADLDAYYLREMA